MWQREFKMLLYTCKFKYCPKWNTLLQNHPIHIWDSGSTIICSIWRFPVRFWKSSSWWIRCRDDQIHRLWNLILSTSDLWRLRRQSLAHPEVNEELKFWKKIIIHYYLKLNSLKLRRIRNLIIIGCSAVLGVPRLLQGQLCSIFNICVYFLAQITSSKVRRSTILEIVARQIWKFSCHTGHKKLWLRNETSL